MAKLIEHDAREFAEAFKPFVTRPQNCDDYVAAYEEGARQVLRYLIEFAAKVNAKKPFDSSTEFEKGQVDGILWSTDYLSTLVGIDR